MSNVLSVRRVQVQTIDRNGNPEGEPSFGIMASDDNSQVYNDTFGSLEELNKAIDNSESIFAVVEDGQFGYVNHAVIGYENYYGKIWNEPPI